MTSAIANALDEEDLEVRLRRALFLYGPDGWNLAEPFDRRQLAARFGWADGGFEIAEEANRRFAAEALAPLAKRAAKLSANGRTGSSSSRTSKRRSGKPALSASS